MILGLLFALSASALPPEQQVPVQGMENISPGGAMSTPETPNQPPVLQNLVADKNSPQAAGTSVTFTAAASDPDGDPLQYQFSLDGKQKTKWSDNPSWTWDSSQNDVGSHTIEVRVKDGKHNSNGDDSRTLSFEIAAPANQPPVLQNLVADKNSPQTMGAVVTWTAQASDPEGDPIRFRFLLNDTPQTDWQAQGQWVWNANEIGTSEIEVQVRDDKHAGPEGKGGNRTNKFTINAPEPQPPKPEVVPARLNQSPALSSLTPDVESPQLAGTIVTWTAEASDAENDPILFRFLLNGTAMTDWQLRNEWDWTANEIGKSEIEVQVRDDQHAGPEGANGNRTAEFTITAPVPRPSKPAAAPKLNQSPVVNSLIADKTSPQPAGSVINWIATATDPENDLISYRFLLNGTPETDWQSQGQWAWTASEIGTCEIEVQVKDDRHAGPEGANGNRTAKFTISAPAPMPLPAPQKNVTNVTTPAAPAPIPAENRTPVVNALTPDKPSPQLVGTAITWTANATDPDQDPILYRFFLNGPGTGGSWKDETEWTASNIWTWTATGADVGSNQIRVWARDGKHAGPDSFDSEQSAYFTITSATLNITGTAFDDKNGNGINDGEPGLAGWTIKLQKPDKSEVSTITKEDGSYRFDLLDPGTYTVSEAMMTGWKQTSPEGSYTVELKGSDATGKDFGNKLTSYSISGMKFNDLDGNGVNDGEPGLVGWTLQLSQNGKIVNRTATMVDGSYRFDNLAPGLYTVSEVEQPGWTRTAPKDASYSVELKDADAAGKDFGNKEAAFLAISGTKFNDVNGNGVRDSGEPGLAGWTVQLSRDGSVINATTTSQNGSYTFSNLAPGSYRVSEVAQDGWIKILPSQGSYSIALKDASVTGMDFGNKGNLSISGVKFYDANGNGVQDSDEPGIPDQPVKLMQSGKEIAATTSGSDGSYTFINLEPGTYDVDDPITVSITTTSVHVKPIPVSGSYSISGVKFNDVNGNGVKDPGEPGIANWGIDLVLVVHGHSISLAQAQTDASGAYSFHNLFPGTYKVSELAKQGWTPTTAVDHTISIPGSASNQNFGNRAVSTPGTASIWGFKFNDINNNGANNGEPGLAGWTIQLRNASNNTVIMTATTDATGWYSFTSLQPGGYIVSELAKQGWTQTAPHGGSYTFTLTSGETRLGMDFGNRNNNLPPTNPTLTSNRKSPQKVGTSVRWTAGATDPEGDPLQFRFFVRGPEPGHSLQADTGYSGNNIWTWYTNGYQPGTYQVEVWIRDGFHTGPDGYDVKKTVSFTLTSPNLPPKVKALYADRPAPQYAGSWIKWTALASDPDGDPIQYRFFLRGPSTGGFWIDQTGWGKNNRWVWRTNPMDVGPSEVLVAVRDGSHAGPGGSDDYAFEDYFIVSLNQPPVITAFGANVQSPQPIGVTVRWQATAFDPEGNLLFYRYWIKGPSTAGLWR
ncbi:MAG TPA: SdrD B-like domain-containing protein, partial [Methanothrix sp.]|nr:SdrD B-like domain-containing protein [Methanothrix sp.]